VKKLVRNNNLIGKIPLDEMKDDEDIIDYFYNNPDKFTTCKFFLEGNCRYGEKCKNLHPAKK